MKIIGFTCTYNEEKWVPYVMPYVEAFGYDKFVVYDNGSTDRTIELLSKYPFVEVRQWNTNGKFDNSAKCRVQWQSFEEARRIAKIGQPDEELVWMTWTDFDEVLFFNSDCDFRGILEGDYNTRRYNAFYKNMVNLFPPREMENKEPKDYLHEGQMFHTYPNVRGNIWVGGMKPTMFAVNAFDAVSFVGGNHYGFCRMRSGHVLKGYDDCCRIYGFHLKFIDKNALKEKWEGYACRGEDMYTDLVKKIDVLYEGQIGISFPLEQYFLHDYFNSELHKHRIIFNGLQEIK